MNDKTERLGRDGILRLLDETLSGSGVVDDQGNIDLSSFDVHDTLCPDFWDEGGVLHRGVRAGLLIIARDFLENLKLNDLLAAEWGEQTAAMVGLMLRDVILTGSLASYSYSEYSDVDLHLVVDLGPLGLSDSARQLIIQGFLNAKANWNKTHGELRVKGYAVELYVEDVSHKGAYDGIYSLLYDRWVKVPEVPDGKFDREYVVSKSQEWMSRIDDLVAEIEGVVDPAKANGIYERMKAMREELGRFRQESLGGMNTYSENNLVYKVLRRAGYLDKLGDAAVTAYDLGRSIGEGGQC